MLWGFSPVLSVFWATVVALVTSCCGRTRRCFPTTCFAAGRSATHLRLGVRQGDGRRLDRHAERRRHLRRRRHHRRRRHADRPRASSSAPIVIDYAGGSLLLTAIYTALVVWIVGLAVPVTASLHHLRGDRRAGADQARRARLRRAHVHLLLRGAVGGVAADGAVAVRRRGDHRRRSVPDDDAVLEVHRCRRSCCRSCSCSTRRARACC